MLCKKDDFRDEMLKFSHYGGTMVPGPVFSVDSESAVQIA